MKTKSVKNGRSKLEILWKIAKRVSHWCPGIVEKIIVGDNFTVILSRVNFFQI